ncbi:uncharacterized protein LOC114256478 [Camellia sinensis]|uniref:uncharacterized protein LOC114256478 n=1 Tax=Camellia sinensis TaxID=4442 RepID=UPI001035DB3E|nr:uncharacterized protein LOC114256478 [Camellia sinensis]
MINPVPGKHDWIETGYDAIALPYDRILVGRPRKERKKAADEAKNVQWVSRKYKTMQSAKCMGFGHNKRSCKGPVHKKSTMFKRRDGPTTSSRKSASQPSKLQDTHLHPNHLPLILFYPNKLLVLIHLHSNQLSLLNHSQQCLVKQVQVQVCKCKCKCKWKWICNSWNELK